MPTINGGTIPTTAVPDAWFGPRRARWNMRWSLAEAVGVDLGIEPEQANVVTSAQ